MKLNGSHIRLGYLNIVALAVITFSLMIAGPAFAKDPKCPCFKTIDPEKLFKKGGWLPFTYTNEPGNKVIAYSRPSIPLNWSYNEKGRGDKISFGWSQENVDYDQCAVSEAKEKWKNTLHVDTKIKSKGRPIPAGSPESIACASIIEAAILSIPWYTPQ